MTPYRPALAAALFLSACAPALPEPVAQLDLVAPDDACSAAETLPDGTPTRFQTPCPPLLTVDLVASLQRALAARGLYDGPVNATMDAPTQEALRTYQATLGIWSPTLSMEAARKLGLLPWPAPA